MGRTIVYIDGFNLYFGLKSKGWKRYYWLNLQTLAKNIIMPGQQLVEVKYFTARISTADASKKKRQDTYLDALATLPDVHIYYGHYLLKQVNCKKCKYSWKAPEEKMTDVCIATELIIDAFNDRFDSAVIVSGDSDLIPPVDGVKNKFPHKQIGIAFPPNRISNDLKSHADYSFVISRTKFLQSVLPDQILTTGGITLNKPNVWK